MTSPSIQNGDTPRARLARSHRPANSDINARTWRLLRSTGALAPWLGAPDNEPAMSVPEFLAEVVAASMVDGSLGWALAIHGPASLFPNYLEPDARDAILATPGVPLIGGVSFPGGIVTASRADGGLELTGTWPLLTSANAVTWAALAALVETPNGRSLRWFLVPHSALQVIPDWKALGLRASGSHSVAVKAETVEERFSFDLTLSPRSPGHLPRFPIYGLMASAIASVAAGVAASSLEAFKALSASVNLRSGGSLGANDFARSSFAFATARLNAARRQLEESVERAWTSSRSGEVSWRERLDLRLASIDVVQSAKAVCLSLYEASGVAGVYEPNRLERNLRDALVVAQHALTGASGASKVGGGELTGERKADI